MENIETYCVRVGVCCVQDQVISTSIIPVRNWQQNKETGKKQPWFPIQLLMGVTLRNLLSVQQMCPLYQKTCVFDKEPIFIAHSSLWRSQWVIVEWFKVCLCSVWVAHLLLLSTHLQSLNCFITSFHHKSSIHDCGWWNTAAHVQQQLCCLFYWPLWATANPFQNMWN